MRIADKMQYEQVKGNIAKNRTQMSELQNQAATQKRVTKPSDDPLAASRVLTNRIDLQGNRQFSKSLNYAKSFLEFTDQSLGDLSEVLMRAKELAISQSNDGSANEESRRVVATEVEQLHNSMINIGNRKLGDRFIFGGFKTQTAPFDGQGRFNGDDGEMNIHIDKEAFVPMNISGGRVFLGDGIDADGMAKQGPRQAKTIEEFNEQQLRDAFPNSVRQPGEGNNGSQVRGPASVTGLEADYGLKSEVEEGDPAGINIFSVMRNLEIALKTNDKEAVQGTLDDLDTALNQVVLTRSQVGSRGMTLDNWMQTLEKAKVDNQTSISSLEDADIFATVSDINKTESTLQATLQTSGKLITPSLLDFLR
ncbi:MAG: flagellar hook-associated protein FlgL [Bdellovibrionales bacterium]|nr:flagellar hook-associated protein FlgL [Bdellovibrionales bacterium]